MGRGPGYLDAVADPATAPVIEKHAGVLGAVEVFTVPTAFDPGVDPPGPWLSHGGSPPEQDARVASLVWSGMPLNR